MTSFYCYDKNPSGLCFLVQIRAFVIETSLGLQNKNDVIVQMAYCWDLQGQNRDFTPSRMSLILQM